MDGVVARRAGDGVGRRDLTRDGDTGRQCRCIDVLEAGDVGGIRRRLIGCGQIDRRATEHDQRVCPGAAGDGGLGAAIVDGVVAATAADRIGPASAVDRVGTRTARDGVGPAVAGDGDRLRRRQYRGIDALEIGDGNAVARRLIGPGRDGEIDRRYAAESSEDQGVRSRSGVQTTRFGAVVVDRVVARARRDRIGTTARIDRIVARAAEDRVGAGIADHADGLKAVQRGSVDVLEVRDRGAVRTRLVGGRRQVENGGRLQDQRVRPGSAVDGRLGAAIGDAVVASAGGDRIAPAQTVDRICARSADDGVARSRSLESDAGGASAGVDVAEVVDGRRVARRLIVSAL